MRGLKERFEIVTSSKKPEVGLVELRGTRPSEVI